MLFGNAVQSFQEWVAQLPEPLQFIGVALIGMIPYFESYTSTFIGVVGGLHPAVALLSGVIGNLLIVSILVIFAEKLSEKFGKKDEELSKRRQKFNKAFDKYGVAGTSLLGVLLLPSHIISFLMVIVAKVNKRKVILWSTVSMTLWALLLMGSGMILVNYA